MSVNSGTYKMTQNVITSKILREQSPKLVTTTATLSIMTICFYGYTILKGVNEGTTDVE